MDDRRPRLGGGSSHLIYLGSLGACLGCSLLASFFGFTALAAFLLFLFALCLASRLWGLGSLERLEAALECPASRFFVGQEVPMRCRLANNKLLPLLWLELYQLLPDPGCLWPQDPSKVTQVTLPAGESAALRDFPALGRKFTFLLWHQSLEWETLWQARCRGVYPVESLLLRGGDGLGLTQAELELPLFQPRMFAVYPRLQPVNAQLFLRDMWDSQWGGKGYLEDVTVIKSSRDYQSTDSWKRINWRMAARQQPLQVNIHETILPKAAHFVLDGQSFLEDPEGLEDVLSLLASVLVRLQEAGVPCGLSLPKSRDFPPADLFAADGALTEDLLFRLAGYQLLKPSPYLQEEADLAPFRLSVFDREALVRGAARAGRVYFATRELSAFRAWSLVEGLEASGLTLLPYREPPADLPPLDFTVVPLTSIQEGGRAS